jgi:hypothetical protein
MEVAIGIALLVFGGLVGVGYIVGTVVSTPGETSDTSTGAPTNCDEFCMAWQKSRADVCMAKANLASASAWYDSCAKASYVAAAAAAAAIAAATAAAWIPIFGAGIAAFLFAISSALVVAAAAAYSLMLGAGAAVMIKASQLNDAEAAQTSALKMVMDNCTGAALTNCLAMPAPC